MRRRAASASSARRVAPRGAAGAPRAGPALRPRGAHRAAASVAGALARRQHAAHPARAGGDGAAGCTAAARDGWPPSLIARFGVSARRRRTRSRGSLSGGNLQKFIVGREIGAAPKVLVVAQPTWGVDVGAAALIRGAARRSLRRGVALLVIVSEDLEELFEICDRIWR